ncbi:ABC transporter ATP-binding protein [Picrophilus oshimae]|uniref:Carbohydrate ABC transporter ATP-binding protein, CUT1 family n=1 Tax=Picrophilus torridus (strain ATCC 700027 / DSM 9790 / JCM 10055 / NBRC 100828 / KAW 2/3) TaxID=1122961 RepID=A0A8G2FW31_PICTO|nr:ABC transporter ATP-binding protein [Picrophilus oshimae]SMD30528.1 carbohydrate ABC transporter ATP-binding protein, CUT1 family [Picrophilus oshimae DSM 9789]
MGIDIEDLNVSYGGNEILKNFNLRINDGEFFVILGSSGSGKTTLLRSIAGLIPIDSGKIYIDGNDVTDLYPSDRNISMIFQNFALYPHMTVFDNISLNLKIRHVPKDEIKKMVNDVTEMLHIKQHLKKYPRQLSGGEQQRVGMARAMIRNPSVFLMDEPLSNLDAKLRREMLGELRSFHEKIKKTIVYVCHDQDEAMALADRILVLNQGNIMQIGTPDDLYEHPLNVFVAGFIGNPPMNIIKCEMENSRLIIEDFSIDIDDDLNGHAYLGIRPEILGLSEKHGIPAAFDYYINSGLNIEVHATIDDSPVRAVIPKEEVQSYIKDFKNGDTIYLSIKPGKLYVFNADSGSIIREVEYGGFKNVERSN